MIKYISLVLLVLVSTLSHAQESNYKSKIKFIDGSEFNVVITENYPGKFVKIILPGSEEVTIKYSSILSIKHKDYSYYSKFIQTKGFYIEVSTSLMFGKTTEQGGSRIGIAAGISTNYQLNSHLSVGAGVELAANENFLMPIYGRLKYNILERRVSPVLLIDAGWSLALTKDEEDFRTIYYDGGWYAKPSVGFQKNNFTLSLGYQLQKISTTIDGNSWWGSNGVTVEERTMKNISLTGSLKF